MDQAVRQYMRLRDRVDARAAALTDLHGPNLVCGPGCCQCCVNLTVFPVEFEAIRQGLVSGAVTTLAFDRTGSCGFLTDGLCSLYEHRPIICRTQGLPLVYREIEQGEVVGRVTFCPRNFTRAADERLTFGPDSTFDLDRLNAELSRINRAYLVEAGASTDDERVELRKLSQFFAGA